MMPGVRALTSPALAALILLTSCSLHDKPEPESRPWGGPEHDLRAQWVAEPGIDLLTGIAIPVRAYIESFQLAQFTQNANDLYPGFDHAVLPNEPDSLNEFAQDRRPTFKPGSGSLAMVGNLRFHLTAVDQSESGATATVCQYNYGAAAKSGDNYRSLTGGPNLGPDESEGLFAIRVTLSAPSLNSTTDLPPQQGPAPAPSGDVFGNWQITGRLTSSSVNSATESAQWPTYQDDLATCVAKAPDPPERRAFLIEGEHPRSDFPTSPANPGWPAATS